MASLPDVLLSEGELEVFYTYAFAQYEGGHFGEAVDTFRVLCTRRPFEGKFWFGLGAALQEAESYKEALQAWAMAALLLEKDPYPHFHAAEVYFSMNEPLEGGKALFQAAQRMEGGHPLEEKVNILKKQWQV